MKAVEARKLLDRQTELKALGSMLTEAANGHGGAIAVTGPLGGGVTALLGAARELAADRFQTASARGVHVERDSAWGAVRQLLARAVQEGGEEVFEGSAAAARSVFESGEEEVDASSTFPEMYGLYWMLSRMSKARPLFLSLDDAQWADVPSLQFLAFLTPRLEELPVALVIGAHATGAPRPSLLSGVLSDPAVRLLHPGPLSPDTTAQLVARRRGTKAQQRATQVHDLSAGLPLLVCHLADQPLDPRDVVAPAATVERVSGLLGRLPPAAERVANAAAVLGAGVALNVVASLAELDVGDAARAADLLASEGLLNPGRPLSFSAPLWREAVYAACPVGERAELHARAARTLEAGGADRGTVAHHLLGADAPLDQSTIDTLMTAARGAFTGGEACDAVRFLARAWEAPLDDAQRSVVATELVRAAVHAGAPELIPISPSDPLALIGDGAGEAPDLGIPLALVHYWTGRARQAWKIAELTVSRAAAAGEVEVALSMLAHLSVYHRFTAAEFANRLAELEPRDTGSRAARTIHTALAAYAHAARGDDDAKQAAELANEALDQAETVVDGAGQLALILAAAALIAAGRLDRADRALAWEAAQRDGWALNILLAHGLRSQVSLRRGELIVARHQAELACEAVPPVGSRALARVAHAFLADVLMAEGKPVEGAWDLDPVAMDRDTFAGLLDVVPAIELSVDLGEGDQGAAVEHLLDLHERRRDAGWRNPALLCAAASAAARARGREDARVRTMLKEMLEDAQAWGEPGVLAVVQTAMATVSAKTPAGRLLNEASVALEDSPFRLQRIRTLMELGSHQRQHGDIREARTTLREARALAESCHADGLHQAIAEELRTTGERGQGAPAGPGDGAEALTNAERRIAALAAEGMTNRQIGETLFVTVKTVETHLSKVYKKLGIHYREQLAASLSENADA